jgi:hypothetical protein
MSKEPDGTLYELALVYFKLLNIVFVVVIGAAAFIWLASQ